MGAGQSKDELLYQQVNYGNIEGIKSLRREGAGLEWIDKEGRTPLILACMRPDLLAVAETLLQLGANVNTYRPGSHGGTPLHHAAKRGLDQTVNLLLSRGANPFLMNDDCQTALELARDKGHCNVVRTIESRISLFSGWLRELFGPSFLEPFAKKWVTKKIWAVVLPHDSRNPTNPSKFQLAIYSDMQTAKPAAVIMLWKVQIEEPKFNQADPAVTILDKTKKRVCKFFSADEGDKQQLKWFYDACRGISQLNNHLQSAPASAPTANQAQNRTGISAPPSTGPPASSKEDAELAMALKASIQSAMTEGVPLSNVQPTGWEGPSQSATHSGWGPANESMPSKSKTESMAPGTSNANGWTGASDSVTHNGWGSDNGGLSSKTSTNGWGSTDGAPSQDKYNGWDVPQPARPEGSIIESTSNHDTPTVVAPPIVAPPSAPPIDSEAFYDGPISYPPIDSSPVDVSLQPLSESTPESSKRKENKGDSGQCVICLDAPVEGACIPCGHMAGCMLCLNEIKGKGWGCPVCRAKIEQIVRLYAV